MPSSKRFTEADCERMAEMREAGASYNVIAREFKCSAKAISWHCLRLGADPPKPMPLRPDYYLQCPTLKRGNHIVRAFTPDEDARLVAMELEGKSITEIARVLGRKWNSCRGRLMTLARRDERAERAA